MAPTLRSASKKPRTPINEELNRARSSSPVKKATDKRTDGIIDGEVATDSLEVSYKLVTIPGDSWHEAIEVNYELFRTRVRPRCACVPFLVFSGITYPSTKSYYFSPMMAKSYAHAFQVHQRPYRTAALHRKWIKALPYIAYLYLVATPVDIFAHSAQFITGEGGAFLEGGAFFIPYMVIHWSVLGVALMSPLVYQLPMIWTGYFAFLRWMLTLHEFVYCKSVRRMSFLYRVGEFLGSVGVALLLLVSGNMAATKMLNA